MFLHTIISEEDDEPPLGESEDENSYLSEEDEVSSPTNKALDQICKYLSLGDLDDFMEDFSSSMYSQPTSDYESESEAFTEDDLADNPCFDFSDFLVGYLLGSISLSDYLIVGNVEEDAEILLIQAYIANCASSGSNEIQRIYSSKESKKNK